MRALVLLFLAISVHAAEVRFFTEHAKVFNGQTAAVFVENVADETILDVRIEIEIAATIDFSSPITAFSAANQDWQCTTSGRRGVCSTARFEPGELAGIFFAASTPRTEGGLHRATATFAARNHSGVAPVIFDIISSHYTVVLSPADVGAGSLRAAIEEVNDNPLCGTDVPCFIGVLEMTIAPATPLPPIRKCNVYLSGPDEGEFPLPTKRMLISGENAAWGNGLEVRASCAAGVPGVLIQNIVFHSWPWNGIYFEAPAAHATDSVHSIRRCYIGTDATGTLPRPNGSRGIVTDSPHEVLFVDNSIVGANGRSGIALFQGKLANVTASGIRDNGASGVFTNGVPLTITRSTIANNAHAGVSVARGTPAALITQTDFVANGSLPVDWGLDGRTPPDDETDGIPNAPRVVDAFFDAAAGRTIVRGTMRLHGAGAVTIEVYQQNGDVLAPVLHAARVVSGEGEVAFEISLNGDLHGRGIALQAHRAVAGRSPHLSSEIGEAVAVR
jgi:hypothetical protein